MRQLDERDLMIVKAAEQLESSRRANKEWFDEHRRLRTENQQLRIGDLVLLHQTLGSGSRSLKWKLQDRWQGPYRITEITPNSTFYQLKELDGTLTRTLWSPEIASRSSSNMQEMHNMGDGSA